MAMKKGGGRTLTSGAKDRVTSGALGPYLLQDRTQHSTTPRDAEQGQPPGAPALRLKQQKMTKAKYPGDPMEGDEKKKSKMMFSFPTQLMELYSE